MSVFKKIDYSKLTISSANEILPKFSEIEFKDDINEILEIINVWASYIGYKITDEELVFLNTFIRETFPKLNIYDLKQCVKRVGKNEFKTEYKGSFTPLYIGQCISEYVPIKSLIIIRDRALKQKERDLLPSPKPSRETLIYLAVENFKIAIERASQGYFSDNGGIIYNLMTNHNLFEPSEELIKKAEDFSSQKFQDETQKSTILSVINNVAFKKLNKEYNKNLYQKNYIVTHWLRGLKKKDIENIIELVKKGHD
jgi:hypothetical protein